MTQPIPERDDTALEEWRYRDFLKTMLAEVCDSDDPIFQSDNRGDLEAECIELGMSLPLVRVIPDAA